MLARAVATECGAHFIAVKGSLLKSRWLGETEENIHQVFAKARSLAPSVVFFDEMDAAVPRRSEGSRDADTAVNQILAEMDGIECLQALRAIDPDVPVLFCSGYADDARMRDLVDQGVLGVVRKPFELATLADTLDAAVGR